MTFAPNFMFQIGFRQKHVELGTFFALPVDLQEAFGPPFFCPHLTCLPSVPGNNFSKFIFSQAKEAKIVVQSGQPANAYELNVGKKLELGSNWVAGGA